MELCISDSYERKIEIIVEKSVEDCAIFRYLIYCNLQILLYWISSFAKLIANYDGFFKCQRINE